MVQVFSKLALNLHTWKFADVWLCSMVDSVIYSIKIYWKKLILLIFFSEYLKLIYFDILEYFHIARTYFATLQDLFYFIFYNNLSKYWIKVNFCLGCWSGLIAWVFVIIQALYNNKMLFWVQCSPNLSYQRSSKRISYVL